MSPTIRSAGPDDALAVHRLIAALAEYEREPDAVEARPTTHALTGSRRASFFISVAPFDARTRARRRPSLSAGYQPGGRPFSRGFCERAENSSSGAAFASAIGDANHALTIDNAAASAASLRIGLVWWVPGVLLAVAYTVFAYRRFCGKVSLQDAGY